MHVYTSSLALIFSLTYRIRRDLWETQMGAQDTDDKSKIAKLEKQNALLLQQINVLRAVADFGDIKVHLTTAKKEWGKIRGAVKFGSFSKKQAQKPEEVEAATEVMREPSYSK